MRKKLLALALVLAMSVSFVPSVWAAEARDTDFFTPRDHADINFADMTYVATDVDAVKAQMDEVRALAADAANVEAVEAGFLEAADSYSMGVTMYILASIYSSMDYTDEAAAEREAEALQNIMLVDDALSLLIRDILASPCASALDDYVPEGDRDYYAAYEGLSDEDLEISNQETALENEYWRLAGQEYSAEYGGKTWTDAQAGEAYAIGEIDYDTYIEISRAIAKEKNAVLGELYLKLVALRRQTAKNEGYSDFTDYAYANIYLRDYTKEDIREFHAGVKEYIAPVYAALDELYLSRLVPFAECFGWDYAGDIALDLMEPYVASLSDELYESFRYMRDHGFYDSGWNDLKNDQGYTTELYAYGAPFYFNAPYGGPRDLTVAVHEFGHYNNDYWTDPGWYLGDKSIDIAEVHSQALELLFTEYYPELFGRESDDILVMELRTLVASAIINGALFDELQQYVYATPNVTLQQINEKYCQLCREYGVIAEDDPRTEMYGWVDVHHTFDQPLYYIAYAVSAAGAFAFWLEAQKDGYFTAVDDYLRFTALDLSYGFEDSFAAVGVESPLTKAYLKELGEALTAAISEVPEIPFNDVRETDWFYDYVENVWAYDLMSGVDLKSFDPYSPITRGMAVTVLYRLAGEEDVTPDGSYTDVEEGSWYEDAVYWAKENEIAGGYGDGRFGPNDLITRQDFAVMLYHLAQAEDLGFVGSWYFLLDSPDAAAISEYADEAMHWMVMNGIYSGREDGSLAPRSFTQRAECAKILTDFVNTLSEES